MVEYARRPARRQNRPATATPRVSRPHGIGRSRSGCGTLARIDSVRLFRLAAEVLAAMNAGRAGHDA
jgi:hypothetical protein